MVCPRLSCRLALVAVRGQVQVLRDSSPSPHPTSYSSDILDGSAFRMRTSSAASQPALCQPWITVLGSLLPSASTEIHPRGDLSLTLPANPAASPTYRRSLQQPADPGGLCPRLPQLCSPACPSLSLLPSLSPQRASVLPPPCCPKQLSSRTSQPVGRP